MDLYEAFNRGRTAGEERKRQSAISQYFQGATRGDPNALAQVYQADPNAGMQAQKFQQSQQDRDTEGLLNAAKFYTQSQDPKAWAYIHQKLTTHPEFSGLTQGMPDKITTPDDLQGSVKLAQSLVSAYGSKGGSEDLKNVRIGADGYYYAVQGGQMVNTGVKADANNQIIEGAGGFYGIDKRNLQAAPVQLGVGPAQPASTGNLDPVNDFASLASQFGAQVSSLKRTPGHNAAVGGVQNSYHLSGEAGDFVVPPDRQAAFKAAAEAKGYQALNEGDHIHLEPPKRGMTTSQFGSGQQLQPAAPKVSPAEQMRLELAKRADERAARAEQRQIQAQAVTGKPPTEDERKAAGWYQQATYALGNMRAALRADPNAAIPGLVEAYVPGQEIKNRSMSPARQRYAQAAASFSEAALRAATGAGINEFEAKQKIAELTPQRGDSDAVIQQKIGALEMYVKSLQSRAGRALPPTNPQAPASNGPKRINSAEEYNALPSGAEFIAPDGSHRRKR